MQAAAERTMQELERVRDNPLALRDFLKRMPKGADLHNHLHSAVYAETFIRRPSKTVSAWILPRMRSINLILQRAPRRNANLVKFLLRLSTRISAFTTA